eukprot:jgi/Psemu1/45117/gm1.45117_g
MEKETTWIDAWIRWDRNSKDIIDDDDDDHGDEEEGDRVPPTAEFTFDYRLPTSSSSSSSSSSPPSSAENNNHGTASTRDLLLTLKGFPSESEQIWNSTGLTLWPSSHYLCEYLLENYRELLGASLQATEEGNANNERRIRIRAVELGSGLGRCGLLLHHILAAQPQPQSESQSQPNNDNYNYNYNNGSFRSHLFLTDGDTDTLAQLRDNVADNTATTTTTLQNTNTDSSSEVLTSDPDHLSQSKDHHHNNNNHIVTCHQLLWGKEFTRAFCERHFSSHNSTPREAATAAAATAATPLASDGVDLVFGSDLVYAPRVIGPLFETVSTLLQQQQQQQQQQHGTTRQQPGGTTTAATDTVPTKQPVFLMAHSDRRQGSSVTLAMVLDGAKNAGLEFEILKQVDGEGIYIIAFKIREEPLATE